MNTNLCELNELELEEVNGGNPAIAYLVVVAGKYVVVPAAKIAAEAFIGGFIVKAIGDLF